MQELLPRRPRDFGEAGYWERFFRERGEQAFEWYGEWAELREPLGRYLRPRDSVRHGKMQWAARDRGPPVKKSKS